LYFQKQLCTLGSYDDECMLYYSMHVCVSWQDKQQRPTQKAEMVEVSV
jgi:hypothetical protein